MYIEICVCRSIRLPCATRNIIVRSDNYHVQPDIPNEADQIAEAVRMAKANVEHRCEQILSQSPPPQAPTPKITFN